MTPGTRLGPYEIVGTLGSGGMGAVYRARDSRLGRDVAIKVSAERFSDRFEREARAIAALNHPNICTLHDVGPDYLVMELVDGPTLADRIRSAPIPIDEALTLARQIADALQAAHDAASSTAISNRRTSRSRPMGGSRSWTSAWPGGRRHRERSEQFADATAGDARRHGPRHRRLHGAGTGARPGGGQTRRHLGLRRRPLRNADGPPAISGRLIVRHDCGPADHRAGLGSRPASRPAPAATLPHERSEAPASRRRRHRPVARRSSDHDH